MCIIEFYFVIGKGNWVYLEEKNSRPGAKIPTKLKLLWKYYNRIIIKTFRKHLFYFKQQNAMSFKVSLEVIILRRRTSIYNETLFFTKMA